MSTVHHDPMWDHPDDLLRPWRDPAPVPFSRRLLIVAAFVAAVFGVDRLVGFACRAVAMRSQYRYSMLYSGRIRADIAVIGNSRGVHSLFAPAMTERLGVPVYNLSLNGIGMDAAALIVSDYLERNPAPKMILLEVTAAEIKPGETIALFQPFFGESARVRHDVGVFQPKRYWASRVFHSFRYNGAVVEKFVLYLTHDDQHWIAPASRKIPAELLAHPELEEDKPIDALQIEAWRSLLAAAQAKGVRVVPFIAPYLPGAIGDRDEAAKYARTLEAAVPGCPRILDYSRSLADTDNFADRVHTNENGARALLELMIADGVFKDAK